MNRVKRSLCLCIGVLLLLVGIQGVQSLWQLSRLSGAADDIVSTGKLSDDSRAVWARFLEVEEAFRQSIAFVDAESADPLRKAFNAKAAALRDDTRKLSHDASGDLKAPAEALVSKVDAWLALAAKHVGTEGVTELPSYHVLDSARAELDAGLRALIDRSEEVSSVTVAASHALARNMGALTIVEMAMAIGLGLLLGWHALKSLHRQLGAEASVMAATARMQQALLHTVDRVRGISHHLADGAQENNDLSQRTEHQAAVLARAGEQGRGFAVVASEVRGLAQRSSGAAKEIKSLFNANRPPET